MIRKRTLLFILPVIFLVLSLMVLFETKNRLSSCIACPTINFTGEIITEDTVAYWEGRSINIPKLAFETESSYSDMVLGVSSENKWIDVDLSEQKLRAYEGDGLFLESLVSTGLPWWPTPKGVFNVWIKLRATKMEGGEGRYYYNLPNVPYVMFFESETLPRWRGYGLHGTYWHNDFGTPHSHGCVNLPTPIAERLYYWTTPILPEGKNIVWSSDENPGTKIVIHD